ncbi:MAG: peptidylprolyl isomerase [Bacteroidales bacterium]|nr:peptidylprolyl isomerase [Bacteroidales bacterium]
MKNIFKQILIINLILTLTLSINKSYSQDNNEVIIDEIIGIVGNNIILQSDVENQYMQYRLQGKISGGKEIKGKIFESLLYQKLLLNQAKIDSIEVTDNQVNQEMDRRMRYFISQLGSEKKLEEFYNKSILEIKEEFRQLIKDQMLVNSMKSNITKDIKITPSEVKSFYKNLPKDSIPLIPSEFEIGHILIKPPIDFAEKQAIKDKLRGFRKRILNGEKFETLAILYSEDKASAKKGGDLGLHGRGEFYPEFEAAAFNLKKGEISDVIETQAGFHIIQMIERKGEYINVRHILLTPKISPLELAKSKNTLDSITELIKNKKYTFEEAAKKFSDAPDKINGGLMINDITGNSKFQADQIDPKIFFVIDKLEEGEISKPVLMKTEDNTEAYQIIFLKERTLPHRANPIDDYDKIQAWALQYKQNDVINDWIDSKIAETYIKISDKYKNYSFEHKWVK